MHKPKMNASTRAHVNAAFELLREHELNRWSCTQCLVLNHKDALACAACGQTKPITEGGNGA